MRSRGRRTLGLAATVLAGALAASAPVAGQSRISSDIDTTRVTVGDRIVLTVSVEHAEDATVAWPDSLALGPFEVLDARVGPTRSADGGAVSSLALTLAAFELGELEIPRFEVSVEAADGSVEVLETDRFVVEVASVGVDEGGDIREIRGPLGIPAGPLRILLSLLLILLPALLVYLLYRRRRRKEGADAVAVRGPPPRSAHELALERLAALEASPMLERGQIKDFHIEGSEILRTYVERRFRIDALEMTTVEVLRGLEGAGVDDEVRAALRRFLEQCDLVKFAKVRPPADVSRETLTLGRWIVEHTIPRVAIPDVDVDTGDEAEPQPAAAEVT